MSAIRLTEAWVDADARLVHLRQRYAVDLAGLSLAVQGVEAFTGSAIFAELAASVGANGDAGTLGLRLISVAPFTERL